LSCPTIDFCAAAADGSFVTSENPMGGPAAWRAKQIKSTVRIFIDGFSCAGVHLCVAVNGEAPASDAPVDLNSHPSGNALVSSNPTSGRAAWVMTNVDGDNFLTGVSCPELYLCVAVDDSGNVITSTHPTAGKAAWKATDIDGRNSLTAVSCPTADFCAAVDDVGNVITATHQT
jgi:hypothetical protein